MQLDKTSLILKYDPRITSKYCRNTINFRCRTKRVSLFNLCKIQTFWSSTCWSERPLIWQFFSKWLKSVPFSSFQRKKTIGSNRTATKRLELEKVFLAGSTKLHFTCPEEQFGNHNISKQKLYDFEQKAFRMFDETDFYVPIGALWRNFFMKNFLKLYIFCEFKQKIFDHSTAF